MMEEKDFLEKYGDYTVRFVNSYKHCFTYSNSEGITVSGFAEYRNEFNLDMTVNEFYKQVDCFYFIITPNH